MNTLQPLKGFRDFLPSEALKRQKVISTIRGVFERFGFDPLETPALESAETLLGKYGGEADKLLYLFEDNGGRKVGLRYDQTVPTARVVAHYQDIPMPFKRYQMQPVWRAENTQKGRYREFLQCDADIIGDQSIMADAEIIFLAAEILKKLGVVDFIVQVNDRTLFDNLIKRGAFNEQELPQVLRSLDKMDKIGREGVLDELVGKKYATERATYIIQTIESLEPEGRMEGLLNALQRLGLEEKCIRFQPTLARGLDYYTSTIFEITINDYHGGSVCGGGRYDRLIKQFIGRDVPAVGFAFGFDRLLDALSDLQLLPETKTTTKALVVVFSKETHTHSLDVLQRLRTHGINSEIYLDASAKLDKQLKYASRKGIPFVVIAGPDEIKNNTVTVKNMQTGEQKTISIDKLVDELRM